MARKRRLAPLDSWAALCKGLPKNSAFGRYFFCKEWV
jgi:hypothetical protein